MFLLQLLFLIQCLVAHAGLSLSQILCVFSVYFFTQTYFATCLLLGTYFARDKIKAQLKEELSWLYRKCQSACECLARVNSELL